MKDVSIEEYELQKYDPITGTNLNNNGEISIDIEMQDLFTHPYKSHWVIKGKMMKDGDILYSNGDFTSETNIALMHFSTNIKHQLPGQEIESVFYPGQVATMLGLLRYPDEFSKFQGLNQLWYKDSSMLASTANHAGYDDRHGYLIESADPKDLWILWRLWKNYLRNETDINII